MGFGSLVFTPAVKMLQARHGSRRQYAAREGSGPTQQSLGPREAAYIAERDGFYWATTGSTGWPYVQYRGGPKGFLRVIDDHTLAFADVRGNKQYISAGNLLTDSRVALILMDYAQQARLKLLGRADVVEDTEGREWTERLRVPNHAGTPERAVVIHVEAFDWNCPQHITPRYTAEEIQAAVGPMEARLRAAEDEAASLRREVERLRPRQP